MSTKLKVDEALLRVYFEMEWKRVLSDPTIVTRHGANTPVIDMLRDEAKAVIEQVLKKFRP